MQFLIETLVNSAMASAATALVAVGLALIFGIMRIENFAHGELYMVGAYLTWYLSTDLEFPYWIGLIGAAIGAGFIGAIMELLLFRRLRSNPIGCLIITVGVLLVLQTAAIWLGGINSTLLVEPPFTGVARIGEIAIPWHRLFVIGAAVIIMIGLMAMLRFSKFGWSLRAVAQDRDASLLQGISINRASLAAMMLSAGLAGIAGALMAPLVRIGPFMGQPVIMTAFIVIIIGGIGSMEGAVIASILYATFITFVSSYYDSTWASIAGLCIMLLVLVFMPRGIAGKVEKV